MRFLIILFFLSSFCIADGKGENKKNPELFLYVSGDWLYISLINKEDIPVKVYKPDPYIGFRGNVKCSIWNQFGKKVKSLGIKPYYGAYETSSEIKKPVVLSYNKSIGYRHSLFSFSFLYGLKEHEKYTVQCSYFNNNVVEGVFTGKVSSNKVEIKGMKMKDLESKGSDSIVFDKNLK